MDDPFAAVDVPTAKHLIDNVLNGILKGRTVILVTHNKTALSVCDHIYSMENGRLLDGFCIGEDAPESIEGKNSENTKTSVVYDSQNDECDSIIDVDAIIRKEEGLLGSDEKSLSEDIRSHRYDIKSRATVMEDREEGSVRASTWMAYARASGGYDLSPFSVIFFQLWSPGFTVFWNLDQYIIMD